MNVGKYIVLGQPRHVFKSFEPFKSNLHFQMIQKPKHII